MRKPEAGWNMDHKNRYRPSIKRATWAPGTLPASTIRTSRTRTMRSKREFGLDWGTYRNGLCRFSSWLQQITSGRLSSAPSFDSSVQSSFFLCNDPWRVAVPSFWELRSALWDWDSWVNPILQIYPFDEKGDTDDGGGNSQTVVVGQGEQGFTGKLVKGVVQISGSKCGYFLKKRDGRLLRGVDVSGHIGEIWFSLWRPVSATELGGELAGVSYHWAIYLF